MKITITTPGRFPPAFLAAQYHESRGELSRIISPVPVARSRRYGVPDNRNLGLAPLGAWNTAFQRWSPLTLRAAHQRVFSAAFDETASHLLGDCDVVDAWCTTALRTIRAAHRRGLPAVLEAASAHVVTQAEILDEECRRFGSRSERAVTSRAVTERTLAEYREADVIVVMSSFARRTFIEQGVREAKIVVVPCGSAPSPPPPRRDHDGVPRVLFVGGFSLRKGLPYLLEAFRRVRSPAELRLVGRPNPALIRRIGGLPPGATVAGEKTGADLDAEYAAADVFVLPSVEDGWGLVTTEAMMAGLPVIVSDAAGSAEIVRDGANGFVVPSRGIDALADRLETLLADAALRRRMGAAARSTAEARTWQTYGDERHDLVYRRLLGLPREESRAHAAAA